MDRKHILLAIAFMAFVIMGLASLTTHKEKIEMKDLQLKSKTSDIKSLQLKYDDLNVKLETVDKTKQEEIRKLQEEKAKVDAEKVELERQLQTKLAEKQRLAGISTTSRVQAAPARVASFGGSCDAWIAAAGINDVASAKTLIARESGCNPNAVNPSSGACGVAQELPCGKSGCSLGDGACQVAWMSRYIQGRYGTWANAVAFHDRNDWY